MEEGVELHGCELPRVDISLMLIRGDDPWSLRKEIMYFFELLQSRASEGDECVFLPSFNV